MGPLEVKIYLGHKNLKTYSEILKTLSKMSILTPEANLIKDYIASETVKINRIVKNNNRMRETLIHRSLRSFQTVPSKLHLVVDKTSKEGI